MALSRRMWRGESCRRPPLWLLACASAALSSGCGETDQAATVTVERTVTETLATPSVVTEAATRDRAGWIGGNAKGLLQRGADGKIAVVARGRYTIWLPIAIRNNTTEPLRQLQISATARDRSAKLVATGSDQGVQPEQLNPGDVGIGYIYFGGQKLAKDIRFEIEPSATAAHEAEFDNVRSLAVAEIERASGKLVGQARNTGARALAGPFNAFVFCFDEGGRPAAMYQGFAEKQAAAAGELVPFTVNLVDPDSPRADVCPRYLVAVSGFLN